MKKSVIIAIAAAAILCGLHWEALAGCELSSGLCSTDSSGHTYRTEEGLGGGYKTTRDGSAYSHTSQTLSGSYRTKYNDGRSETQNYDPYKLGDSSYYSGRRR